MPTFSFKSLDPSGRDVIGQLEAPSHADVVRELTARGLYATDVVEGRARRIALFAERAGKPRFRIRLKPLSEMTRQLATSLDAGLPLVTALEVIGEELEHTPSRELLKELRSQVQEGASLSEALAEHPRVFHPMYVRLVRVGETSGMLDAVLTQLADMLERQTELRDRIKTASIYPAIVLMLGFVSVVIIVSFIIPRIVNSIGADPAVLPLPTRLLMGASAFLGAYWWLLLGLMGAAIAGWRHVLLQDRGRAKWDTLKLRIPLLGRLVRQLEAARFSRSLGMLAEGGVAITEGLAVARDTIQNAVMRGAVRDLEKAVHAGDSIARSLQQCGLFPPLLVQMIRVGENTGRLGEMLLRAARVHESEARVTLDRFVGVLPVVMILVLACVIGFIVAGLVLAIVEVQTTGMGVLPG